MATQEEAPFEKSELLLAVLGLLCLGYSTYQTAQGYEKAAGGIVQAWTFSAIIGLTLAFLILLIRKKLMNGAIYSALLVLIIYIGVALLSFGANFNNFFSNSINVEVYERELENCHSQLTSLKTNSITGLDKFYEVSIVNEKVKQLQITLRAQILDITAKSYGKRAKEVVSEIEKILKIKLTEPYGTAEAIVTSFDNQISDILNERSKKYLEKVASITNVIENLNKEIDTAQLTDDDVDDKIVIGNFVKTFNDICQETNSTIRDTVIFKCNPVVSIVERQGKISNSLSEAYKRPIEALVAAIQSGFIDILLPVLLFFSSYKPVKKNPKGGTREKTNWPIRRRTDEKQNLDEYLRGKGKNEPN